MTGVAQDLRQPPGSSVQEREGTGWRRRFALLLGAGRARGQPHARLDEAKAPATPDRVSEARGDQRLRIERATELKEAIRQQAQLVAESDEVDPPDHLLRLVGPVPEGRKQAQTWREAAAAVASYRARWAVSDVGDALGGPPVTPAQSAQLAQVRRSAERLASRELSNLEREPMENMSLGP